MFVWPLSMEEGRKLHQITRRAKDPVKLRRAIVVLMSAQGQSALSIKTLMRVSDDYVRDVVHAFNEPGGRRARPKMERGRPRRIGEWVRERICLIARTIPAEWGVTGFSTWSLAKLAAHLKKIGLVTSLFPTHLGRILKAGRVSWQTTTTWKSSNDPDFIAKMRAVLTLYDRPPQGGRVICVDEIGPLNLQPRTGKAWRPTRSPRRLRATYTATMASATCLAPSAWPRASSTTASAAGNAGRSSCPSSRACAAAGPASTCTSSWTTTRRTSEPKSGNGPPPTTSTWSFSRPTGRG
nr:hypothetical protein [Actinomadura violacea]